MWQVEKKISACISCERAKAYGALVEQHRSMSDHLTGRDGSGDGSSEMVDAEEEFCKSISNLISTVITEGTKIPGECGVALTSNIIWLVPTLPLNPVLAPSIDLPLEKQWKITLGNTSRPFPAGHGTSSSLPSLPLTGGMGVPVATSRSTIVRSCVPEFPHSSATFNIILGSHIQAFSQSSYKEHWMTAHVLCSAVNHIQCQPIGTSQA